MAVLVGGEVVVRQFIREDDQFDVRVPLQFLRNMEGILVQLPALGGNVATKQILI